MTKEETWLLSEKYGGEKSEAFFADCERLAAGEPLGYVIGWVPFLNCKIYLGDKTDLVPIIPSSKGHQEFLSGDRTGINVKKLALIPRSETEFWVEQAIIEIKRAAPLAPRVLDLCAGSGCIGVAVAKAIPNAEVTFAEIDPTHLPTIEKNLTENLSSNWQASAQYEVIASDLFENVFGKYDYILSNPPYIDPALNRTETSVKDHEPHQALYGGHSGMEIISRIIEVAPQHLNPTGELWLEHEPEQVVAIRESAAAVGRRAVTHPDQYGVPRYSIISSTAG